MASIVEILDALKEGHVLKNGKSLYKLCNGIIYAKDEELDSLDWRESDFTYQLHQVEILPRTVKIGDYEFVEPLRKAPAAGTTVYCLALDFERLYKVILWEGNVDQLAMLEKGILHLSFINCQTHAQALLSLS